MAQTQDATEDEISPEITHELLLSALKLLSRERRLKRSDQSNDSDAVPLSAQVPPPADESSPCNKKADDEPKGKGRRFIIRPIYPTYGTYPYVYGQYPYYG